MFPLDKVLKSVALRISECAILNFSSSGNKITCIITIILYYHNKYNGFINRVRYFRRWVANFNQSEARKQCFLASDWLLFETLPRKYRTQMRPIEIGHGGRCTTNPSLTRDVKSNCFAFQVSTKLTRIFHETGIQIKTSAGYILH